MSAKNTLIAGVTMLVVVAVAGLALFNLAFLTAPSSPSRLSARRRHRRARTAGPGVLALALSGDSGTYGHPVLEKAARGSRLERGHWMNCTMVEIPGSRTLAGKVHG
jgi:hypothetical protein